MTSHHDLATRIIGNIVQASAPAVSPDGTQVAFVVTRVDVEGNTYRSQVWLAAADGSTAAAPITGGDHDGQPTWSPDGSRLAFTSARSEKQGEATLHVLPVGTPGEVRTVATMADGVATPRFSPDGRWLAFTSRTRHERYDAKDESWQAPRKIERFFSRLDNEGWIADRPSHVYVVPVDGTAAPRNLTPGEFQHAGIAWLADSAGVITSAQRHDTWDLDFATDLYEVRLDGEVRPLTVQTGLFSLPSVSPDGTLVACHTIDDPATYPQNAQLAVLPVDGHPAPDRHRFLTAALDRTTETTAGSVVPVWEGDDSLLATAEDRGQTHVVRAFADGRDPEWLTSGPLTVKSLHAAGGTIAITASRVDRVADLFVLRDGEVHPLTDLGERYAAAASPRAWERFAVPTADGTAEVDAWIMRPAGFADGERYPVLLNVHGGPHTQYGETLFDEAQVQAAAGFVVLMCNPRGSSGREQRWGQSIMGPKHPHAPGTGWGSVDVDDVLAVLAAALDRYPFCDRDRVGMIGGSYGGFMATWLAARHGEHFRAICSERAVNNMLSEEWSSDIGSIFRVEHGPTYLDDPESYTGISPIRWIRDIHTPMLLLHSEQDLRCPVGQAEELFMGLRLLGREVTFYRFPGEGHELSRSGSPVHRVQRAEIVLDFFSEHLKR